MAVWINEILIETIVNDLKLHLKYYPLLIWLVGLSFGLIWLGWAGADGWKSGSFVVFSFLLFRVKGSIKVSIKGSNNWLSDDRSYHSSARNSNISTSKNNLFFKHINSNSRKVLEMFSH